MTRIRLSREFTADGYQRDELARLTRQHDLVHVRRGAYAEPPAEALTPQQAHLQLLEATVRQSSPEAVASHISAAVVHDLPTWNDSLGRVHLSRDRTGGARQRRYSEIHSAVLPDPDVVIVNGIRVTSLARTVVDLGCSLSMERAVAAGDAALRRGVDPAELAELLERGRGRRGIARACRSIAFLDGRSESAGESVSRVKFHLIDLPKPDLQYDVYNADGRWMARTDFWWEDFNTVGEFDGRIKYGRALQPEQPIEDVLFDEKLREDAVRDQGKQMARWIWGDLYPPLDLKKRLERAFARGERTSRGRSLGSRR